MRIHLHLRPFRLGLATFAWGVRYRLPWGKWHAIGPPFEARSWRVGSLAKDGSEK